MGVWVLHLGTEEMEGLSMNPSSWTQFLLLLASPHLLQSFLMQKEMRWT